MFPLRQGREKEVGGAGGGGGNVRWTVRKKGRDDDSAAGWRSHETDVGEYDLWLAAAGQDAVDR